MFSQNSGELNVVCLKSPTNFLFKSPFFSISFTHHRLFYVGYLFVHKVPSGVIRTENIE